MGYNYILAQIVLYSYTKNTECLLVNNKKSLKSACYFITIYSNKIRWLFVASCVPLHSMWPLTRTHSFLKAHPQCGAPGLKSYLPVTASRSLSLFVKCVHGNSLWLYFIENWSRSLWRFQDDASQLF